MAGFFYFKLDRQVCSFSVNLSVNYEGLHNCLLIWIRGEAEMMSGSLFYSRKA